MLHDNDKAKFVTALIPEIRGLQDLDVFKKQTKSQKPKGARLLSSIWSYKRKRSPIGTILKYKSRLCVDGSQQELDWDYWEKDAPVVSWSTICLLLLLSSILNLKSCQLDYTQAFPQEPLEDPVYMRMPQGWFIDTNGDLQPHSDPTFHDKEHYIKLKKNLYGCKQAARNWFKYLTHGLLSQGFVQSKVDPCLYLWNDYMMVVYTDNCLVFARDDKVIDELITTLSATYKLEVQGRVNHYLGIHIMKVPQQSYDHHASTRSYWVHSNQPTLIKNILNFVTALYHAPVTSLPTVAVPYTGPVNSKVRLLSAPLKANTSLYPWLQGSFYHYVT